jgi:methyl-accepting chemotaxis protein
MDDSDSNTDSFRNYSAMIAAFAVAPAILVMVGLWIVIGAGSAAQRDILVAVTFWSVIVALSSHLAARYLLRARLELIADAIETARALARDEGSVLVRHDGRDDDMGELARALRDIQDKMRTLRAAGETASAAPPREAIDAEVARVVSQWRSSLRGVLDESANLNATVRETALGLSDQVKRAAHDAASARQASSEGSLAVASLAAAVDQIAGAVREINARAGESARIVQRASEAGAQAGLHVNQLATTVRRIGNVIGSIRAIAEQTNLLALNATIEAARAGEAGRGFAVVAAEVKSLATETAKATSEITTLVASIHAVTNDAVQATQGIVEQLQLVDQTSRVIVSAVEEQEASTNEIARASANAARFSMTAHEKFEAIEAIILAAGAAAYQLDGVTNRISSASARLNADMDRMLADTSTTSRPIALRASEA